MKNSYNNLSVVILDDDDASILYLKHLINITRSALVTATFNHPGKFLEKFNELDFDVLILDCDMPEFNGKEIVKRIGRGRCIVNTASELLYEQAIKCHPIDILIKPVNDIYLIGALEKASKLISFETPKIGYYMFNVAESKLKVKIRVSDFLYLSSDKTDPRNKEVILKSGQKYTLMDYSFKELLEIAPDLIPVNHSEAVSIEIIHSKGFDEVILDELPDGRKISVTLSETYRQEFKRRCPDL
jgi:DNA-binding LytR/AlgR family response regulator